MLTNRSAPHARVTPVLIVADIRAAVAWYTEVLGFVEHLIGEGHRAQLGLPDGPAAELVVAEEGPGRRVPDPDSRSRQVVLKVDDAPEVLARSLARGAVLVDPSHDWEYGERQATLNDPFGHQWVLTQTLADVARPRSGAASP